MSYNSALKRLTMKKGDELSKFLGIESGPSTTLIATMQARINNPLFKLSMADYEAMCGNKIMVKMMSKVVGCEEKQLNKFCKYINVFKENIKSSPKSIKNKMNAAKNINASKNRGSLNLLPDDIYHKIVEKYKTIFRVKYVLKDWIPINKLIGINLCLNPNAVDFLKENKKLISWILLSENSNGIDLLKEHPDKINWEMLSKNPNAIELLREKFKEEKNMNQNELYKLADSKKIDWYKLSQNPAAIDLLKANPEKIVWDALSVNPSAIELLETYPENIHWQYLSMNKGAIELLRANPENIDWNNLSQNPNAIELLKANPEKVNWDRLSINPNAIEILKANKNKINWHWLSSNPNAIELLEANQDKIDWYFISKNPAIFDEILI